MRWLALILIMVFFGSVVVLPWYLGPDDLSRCELRPTDTSDCERADAIVAVSGGDTTARAQEAIRLYKAGWAPLLIFSGAAQDTSGPSNARAMKRLALAEQVPAQAIVIEEFSRNTEENAENTSRFIERRELERVILVTSAYHQRRASLEFGQKLSPSVAITNHPVASDNQWGPFWWLSWQGWWLALGELVKVIAFYVAPQGNLAT